MTRLPPRLDGRVAVVTGAGAGIGKAVTERLATEGAAVVVVDRDAATAEETAAGITAAGGSATSVVLDLADRAERARVVPAALDRFGRLDVLVNNAAHHGPRVPFLDLAPEDWDLVIETNLTAAADLCRDAARHMVDRREGAIVNVSAVQERLPLATYAAYGASKGGVSALTRALAVELSPQGVRVNAVAPGVIDTVSWQRTLGDDQVAVGDGRPKAAALLGRQGLPQEVAGAVAFLASDDASFVTGSVLPVDGGRSISRRSDPFEARFGAGQSLAGGPAP